MDISVYKTALEVAKWQNFTKAADMLGYAQSSVTSQIQKLEADYGIEMFERIGKKMKPTPAGEELLRYAAKLVRLYEESKVSVAGQTAGSFILGTFETTLASYMLPPYLGSFKKLYPQFSIVLGEVAENDIYRSIKAGECDMGFVVEDSLLDPDLRFEPIREEEFILIAHPDHPLAQRDVVHPADLNGTELLMSTQGCRCRRLFEQMLRSRQVKYTIPYEINNYETVKKCVMHGLGISIIPKTIVLNEIKTGQLAALPLHYPAFKLMVHLCYHVKKQISKPMRAFIESLCGTTQPEWPAPAQSDTALPL
ncbi:LysR family transcriptional regulator [Paenibacillus hexagrammi]|uniref:LysR family transcriptional regulator n=1 Tax=Paenibacillus hexagrammi TaxID=2908839 RepID=A0ABY3SMH7_9BACL|nr:LysR family transcriptional regulator [Paenibacillus sp. YPD9-1]UJF35258.1 LysR family transcriptional regulator [Paenibacillus sp. YPD9-1]